VGGVAERNAERAAIYEAVLDHAADLPEAQARFLEMRQETGDPVAAFEAWGSWALQQLEHLRELALGAVERVQEMAVSAWDNLVAAMSPMSDFALAERATAEECEAELDRAIDEVLAEMDAPAPQPEREDREHAAEVEAPEDDWVADLLDEMDREEEWERGHEREPPGLELEL